ncbi:glycosyltransferase family 2 protein [Subtercola frigoramans]|uniref:4,4'-diaponeurosporenoate glycosyltransferase n=1 Tax=Subtercola frigoramans TaxID=120298 RepID=A0ABS2L0K8_9MICO|nr:glycosyltransferase [Subtercola frigoramans]MBM7470612.1 hypothetical protein [Subtercola frigoramans]
MTGGEKSQGSARAHLTALHAGLILDEIGVMFLGAVAVTAARNRARPCASSDALSGMTAIAAAGWALAAAVSPRSHERRTKTVEASSALSVSVVIPAKNDAVALARCLEALERQTRRPDEIIVIDNASTDSTADVARIAGARVLAQIVPGIPAAAGAGYDAARCDII